MTMLPFPKVSLIISNFNGRDMLRDCLNSLRKMDYPNFEIIVVDAASTDGTPEMIRREFPEVILVEGNRRFGIGEAINIGIARSKGEIIGFDLNNDEIFSKDWLGYLVKELLSTEDKKVVGGARIIYGTAGIVDTAGEKMGFLGEDININHGKRISEISLKTQEVDYVDCSLFHVSILDKIRPLYGDKTKICDEKYHLYFEDSDFGERARRMGYKVICVYSAISYHRGGATIVPQSAKSYYFVKRGRLRFMIKHFSIPRLFFASTWWFLTLLRDVIIFFPLTQKYLLYRGWSKMEPRGQAIIGVIRWNITNMKDHFRARMEETAILEKRKQTISATDSL